MLKSVCVFSASSDAVAPKYFAVAEELGALIAHERVTLIYGGGKVGLMGALARAVHQQGGRVVGVIPHYLRAKEICYEAADELVVTRDLRERKAVMEERSDAFLTLPGGFGTLEEILEILTLKQLRQHTKPIVLLNTDGFYAPLLGMFEQLYAERFTKADYRHYYHVAAGPREAFAHLASYAPPAAPAKWF